MQHCWFPGMVLFMAHVMSVNVAVNPACECVVYQSYGKSRGKFHSPNFPTYYSRDIDCILFTFVADVDEIVEISFIEFDLKWKSKYTGCGDYLRLFINLDRAEINEHSPYDVELCGNISHMDQKTYYSKGRSLIMEFHSDASNVNHTGFKGQFAFLDKHPTCPPDICETFSSKGRFITKGNREVGTQCTYTFQSRDNHTRGNFYSLLYPQNYPSHLNCQYRFYGKDGEKVKIKFLNIQLYNNDNPKIIHNDIREMSYVSQEMLTLPENLTSSPVFYWRCTESKDIILVYNGRDQDSELVKQFCGSQNGVEYVSSGQYLYVEFHSDDRDQSKGFAATYTFLPEIYTTTQGFQSIDPTGPFVNCNKHITSHMNREGTITSQNYPKGPYPSSTTCVYEFEGERDDQIQIVFTDMNLVYTGGDHKNPPDCVDQDSITIILRRQNIEQKTWIYCGSESPVSVMSNGPWMKIQFNSVINSQRTSYSGFQFKYRIRKDFGITTGRQTPGVCRIIYNSSESPSGNFTSPNYPGYYPREIKCEYIFRGSPGQHVKIRFSDFDLVARNPYSTDFQSGNFTSPNYGGYYPRNITCQYIFYGRRGEKINIGFSDFDVNGVVSSCGAHQDSDYVAFSNFEGTEDRKMKNRCGDKPPQKTTSDGAFFNVTFISDDQYDGKGFLGHYEFVKEENQGSTPAPLVDVGPAIKYNYILICITIGLSFINKIMHHKL